MSGPPPARTCGRRLPGAERAPGRGVVRGGLLYTQTWRGTIGAWDPATGRQKWSTTLDSASMQYPPVWYDALVYLQDGSQDGRCPSLALRADTGARVWTAAPRGVLLGPDRRRRLRRVNRLRRHRHGQQRGSPRIARDRHRRGESIT
ncbi:PQQ-binding-like beta-propeller repeat protein [Streptomyces sp. NPDC021608]|uniref:outer membrane protein assembly factor BamB family protein n=1 Tax=Streptomyces sp. NPDC021608 TaxID=3154903 RepID=UPI0034117473